MPIYDYRCQARDCGYRFEVWKRIDDIERAEVCSLCGKEAGRQVAAPMVVGDYAGYNCPITGDWIEGRKAHEANLAKHGCRVLETGEIEGAQRRRDDENEKLANSMAETAAAIVDNMPSEKKEALGKEMERNEVGFSRHTYKG